MLITESFFGFIVVVAVVGTAMFLFIGTAMNVYAQNTTMQHSNKIKQMTVPPLYRRTKLLKDGLLPLIWRIVILLRVERTAISF